MHHAIVHISCLSTVITSRLQLRQLCPRTIFSQSSFAHVRFRAPCSHQDISAARACSLHSRRGTLGPSQRSRGSATARADAAAIAIGQDSCSSSAGKGGLGAYSSSEDSSPVSFEMCRIPGDGSCLFRALAQGQHQLQRGQQLCHTGKYHTCTAQHERRRHLLTPSRCRALCCACPALSMLLYAWTGQGSMQVARSEAWVDIAWQYRSCASRQAASEGRL